MEFKTERANLPGMLGSVTYQTIWISAQGMRVDFGALTTKIIRKNVNQVFELDHNLKEYCPVTLDRSTQEESLTFHHAEPFVQSWNSMTCQVFEYQQDEGDIPFHFKIWFSDLTHFPMDDYLAVFLDMDQSVSVFPDGPPSGFPVRVTMDLFLGGELQQVLHLALENMSETKMPAHALDLPSDYQHGQCAPDQ